MSPDDAAARAIPRKGLTERLLLAGGLTFVYFAAGKLGLSLAFVNESATAVWPPTGIAIAALLVLGMWAWPAIFAGAFLVNVTTSGGVLTSAAIATGNTLEALLAAFLVNAFAGGRRAFERPQTVLAFTLLAGIVSTMVSATIGVAALVSGGLETPANATAVWLTWWLGDAAGALIFAPPVILIANRVRSHVSGRRVVEAAGLAASGLVGALVILAPNVLPVGDTTPFQFLVLPIIAWAAFRFGPTGTAMMILILSLVGVWGTVNGYGPFQDQDPNESLLLLQMRTAVLSITGLVFAAAVHERRLAFESLKTARDGLEARVVERTSSLLGAIQALEREIGERRRAETKLRTSEAQLANAQRVARLGSWEWNVVEDRVTWSDELYRLFGLSPGSSPVDYRFYLSRVHPEDREFVDSVITAAYASPKSFEFEHRVALPDGSVRWIHSRGQVETDAAGKAIRMFGTAQDVSATKLAEERFRAVLESAPDGMLVAGADGRIVYANSQMGKLFGFAREELVGKAVEALMPERFREAHEGHRKVYSEVPTSRPMGGGLELRARRKDGTEFSVEVSLSPLETGTGLQTIAAVRDVTERKKVDAVRIEAQRLAELNRYKSQFINMAAHELATPLTPMKLQLHLLKSGAHGSLSPAQAKALSIVTRNEDRLATLVGEMLDVARLESGRMQLKPQAIDIGAAVDEAVESFGALAGASGVHLVNHVAHGVSVAADPLRISQVFANLLSNAIKFTPAGGEVVVEAEAHDGQMVVHVADTGVGLTPDQLKGLFQPFSQVHEPGERSKGGTGLGLYISKGIVALHGGRMWCDSGGPGKGAIFNFTLPMERSIVAPP